MSDTQTVTPTPTVTLTAAEYAAALEITNKLAARVAALENRPTPTPTPKEKPVEQPVKTTPTPANGAKTDFASQMETMNAMFGLIGNFAETARKLNPQPAASPALDPQIVVAFQAMMKKVEGIEKRLDSAAAESRVETAEAAEAVKAVAEQASSSVGDALGFAAMGATTIGGGVLGAGAGGGAGYLLMGDPISVLVGGTIGGGIGAGLGFGAGALAVGTINYAAGRK